MNSRYENEKVKQLAKCTECHNGYIIRRYREKRVGQNGFPMSIKVTHKCNHCGYVEFKHDYTDMAKIDWQEYIDESSASMRKFHKYKRMRKKGEIDDDTWNQLVDAGVVW